MRACVVNGVSLRVSSGVSSIRTVLVACAYRSPQISSFPVGFLESSEDEQQERRQ
jgi:16S rRNA C1402 (ribose-2'-O) methylase RsmI